MTNSFPRMGGRDLEGRFMDLPHDLGGVFNLLVLTFDDGNFQILVTELTPLQRQIIQLLGLSPDEYGR